MRIFLTGATGFVGHHVAKALAARAPTCACWCARPAISPTSKASPATRSSAISRSRNRFAPALAGCDAVVHVAADYRLWIRDPQAMYRANVDGTRELLRMAREADVHARRLHIERRHHALPHRRHRHQRRHAGFARRHGRPLQALEVSGRAGSDRRREERPAGHHSQPHHAHRPQRRQAHAHGPHLRRLSQRQVSRLRRYRPEPRRRDRGRAHPRYRADDRASPGAATFSAART